MPELPEVETVRRGLADLVVGRTVESVVVLHPRAIRRHTAGEADFVARLFGRRIDAACRRGKYLWLTLDSGEPLLAHLGMSGQFLMSPGSTPGPHDRVLIGLVGAPVLRFADQRTFGGLSVEPVDDAGVPLAIAHIAADPFEPGFDRGRAVAVLRRRNTGVKRALLDQTVVSGIGNIYADEALWRARVHYERPTRELSARTAGVLIDAATAVMAEALAAGGTSFDALYVNVNGESGWFDRSLQAYGQEGRPCGRCGTAIRRARFTNRSSYFCPRCQRH
jgi:formamidopyrimidine-DNA glycosylase